MCDLTVTNGLAYHTVNQRGKISNNPDHSSVLSLYLEPVGGNIRNNDFRRPHGLSRQQVDETDGTGSTHQDRLPKADPCSLASVDTYRQWLHKRPLFEGHVVRQLEAEVCGVLVVAAKVTVIGRGGAKLHVEAEVVATGLAFFAHPAGDTGLDGHTVAGLEVGHLRSTPDM